MGILDLRQHMSRSVHPEAPEASRWSCNIMQSCFKSTNYDSYDKLANGQKITKVVPSPVQPPATRPSILEFVLQLLHLKSQSDTNICKHMK